MLDYLWLCLAALGAGAVNAIAGGGTLLTFPTLTSVASPVFANGTSTVALFPGSLASAWGFRRELEGCRRWIWLLTPPSILGGAVGTLLATQLDEKIFATLVPWLILLAAVLFLLQPTISRWLRKEAQVGPPTKHSLINIFIGQFFIAIYGGYFGAGIGILMLSSLSFLGLSNIHQVNALKTFLAFGINVTSALLFMVTGKVLWPYALAMMGTAIVGGYLGAHYSRKLPPSVVRAIVISIGFGLAAFYFWKQWQAE
jgi:uncharacterized membrane protein YfcA